MFKLSSRLVFCGGFLHAGPGPHHITSYRTYDVKMSATNTILNQFNPNDINSPPSEYIIGGGGQRTASSLSRYESQKRRDWNIFGRYLRNHKPPLVLSRCSGAHILEFLRYLDQFGKTKVHNITCPFFGHPHPPAPCPCPLKQAWGSLDAFVGRLRATFEENGGTQEANPFGARAVSLYLREVRDSQTKARGIAYEKKKRKRPQKQADHGGGIITFRQEFCQQ